MPNGIRCIEAILMSFAIKICVKSEFWPNEFELRRKKHAINEERTPHAYIMPGYNVGRMNDAITRVIRSDSKHMYSPQHVVRSIHTTYLNLKLDYTVYIHTYVLGCV